MANLINNVYTIYLNKIDYKKFPPNIQQRIDSLRNAGWKFYCVEQTCGKCWHEKKEITIPKWVLDQQDKPEKKGQYIWYVSHEIAHALNFIAGTNDHHGPCFMEWLKKVCPKDAIHWELTYKPRNAQAAGIYLLDEDDI